MTCIWTIILRQYSRNLVFAVLDKIQRIRIENNTNVYRKLTGLSYPHPSSYDEAIDKLTDKKNEIEIAAKEADKWREVASVAKAEMEYAQFELAEAERLKKELLGVVDGDSYRKEQVIELRYQNHVLEEENKTLKDKLEKAYEFMKQFVIGGMNLLEKFKEWIGEKVRDVGRGR